MVRSCIKHIFETYNFELNYAIENVGSIVYIIHMMINQIQDDHVLDYHVFGICAIIEK